MAHRLPTRLVGLALAAALTPPGAAACPWCRDSVRAAALAAPDAGPTALLLLAPLAVVALVGAALYAFGR